jgi:hypothetical protein
MLLATLARFAVFRLDTLAVRTRIFVVINFTWIFR